MNDQFHHRRQIGSLAYKLCTTNNCSNLFRSNNEMAGVDWLHGFSNRHPNIYLRKPEATSIALAMGFNEDVCFLLGNSPLSEFCMPTFQNTLSLPSS